jgi:tetratricopeptide (TPR) repeat protein
VINEGCLSARAQRLAAAVPTQEFANLASVWGEYDGLARRSWFNGAGTHGLEVALVDQTQILADRVIDSYRTSASTVWSKQWSEAEAALLRAAKAAPDDEHLRGTLRYVQGHLHRIDGETRKRERQTAQAERQFARAVTAFREAAKLRRDWPDPFLGLARTFIYGIADIDRGADALRQAERQDHKIGPRETAQLAYGYGVRGGTYEQTAAKLEDMPQEREYLTRARDDYRRALDLYVDIASFGDVPRQMRVMQRRLERVEDKLNALDEGRGE